MTSSLTPTLFFFFTQPNVTTIDLNCCNIINATQGNSSKAHKSHNSQLTQVLYLSFIWRNWPQSLKERNVPGEFEKYPFAHIWAEWISSRDSLQCAATLEISITPRWAAFVLFAFLEILKVTRRGYEMVPSGKYRIVGQPIYIPLSGQYISLISQ